MKQFNKNVQIVMEFLKEEKHSPSVISLYWLCYKDYRYYLLQEGLLYSFVEAGKWIDANKVLIHQIISIG